MTASLRSFLTDRRTERVITGLIILNAVILGLETSPTITERFGRTLELLDHILLGIFVVEIVARIFVYRTSFFRDPWNIFDFVVVGISLAPATDTFSVLRALRVLRVLRLIAKVESLRRVVGGLIAALPGMGSILLLIGLIFYVFAVMATKLFGEDAPQLFGSLGASLFTLFTVMTLEGWVDGVVRPLSEKHPYAWLFFIPFIVGTTFTVLNLFIGIIVNSMQSESAKAEKAEREAERDMIEEETEPILQELRDLRVEVAALRAELKQPPQVSSADQARALS